MTWNWQNAGWPNFKYDAASLVPLEQKFLQSAGKVIGAVRHFNDDDSNQLRIELLSDEAVETSEIEGEFLDRISVQSSPLRQFGLKTDDRQICRQKRWIAEMMADLYRSWHRPLRHEGLFHWHSMLMAGNRYIETIGAYRQHGFRGKLNERQEKVVARIVKKSTAGFKGGLSADNYRPPL